MTDITDGDNTKNAEEMLEDLIEGQEVIVRAYRNVFPAAEEAADEPTCDLLTARMQLHEKNAWMLRAVLGK